MQDSCIHTVVKGKLRSCRRIQLLYACFMCYMRVSNLIGHKMFFVDWMLANPMKTFESLCTVTTKYALQVITLKEEI
uniref:Uncharacterized protein n=1 Tax=Nelumbo nucifera TaxID=4432 RepID=A0A822Y9M3_NELNU|nr:TPA_asm: hypothetical protein HUJ06_029314 [Nelumbo nucifera]